MILSAIIVIIGLLGAAFFAGTETALVTLLSKSDKSRKIPQSIAKWLEHPRTIFSVTLVGTNICIIVASSLSTSIAINIFGYNGALISLLTITVISLIFCEILPKSRALVGPESFARFASLPFNIAAQILKPITKTTDWISGGIVNLIHKIISPAPAPNWEEFELIAREGEINLGSNRNALFVLMFDYARKTVFDIMTPRARLSTIPVDASGEGALNLALDSDSPILIVESEGENIDGVLDVANLLESGNINVADAMTEPFFVPETTPIMRLFAEMCDSDIEYALVVDEYGNITGGVLRDHIADIFSGAKIKLDSSIRGKTATGYIVDGAMDIDRLDELLGAEFPRGPYRTVAGLIEELTGEIPEVDCPVVCCKWRFIVTRRNLHKILRLKIEPVEGS